MSKHHQAFVFDEAAFRRELAPLLDRQADAALESFINDHRARLRDPETGAALELSWRQEPENEGFARRAALALTAFYDPTANIGLGSSAQKCRFALMDLYPEGRVFVGGGSLGVPEGHFQSAGYVAESVVILERLQAEHRQKADVIDPVLTMLQAALHTGRGLYILL